VSRIVMVAAAACCLTMWLWVASPGSAATTEYLVVDRHSGLAIGGFDPLSYFIDGSPRLGKGEFELRHAGAVWRFRNEGNRAAFAAHPEVYSPRFGGYDAFGIARGVGLAGNPLLWAIAGERLYFFYSPENKTAFAVEAGRIIAVADKRWPAVQLTLSP
jgi:hypothetical protein